MFFILCSVQSINENCIQDNYSLVVSVYKLYLKRKTIKNNFPWYVVIKVVGVWEMLKQIQHVFKIGSCTFI